MKPHIPFIFLFCALSTQAQDFFSWRFNDRYFSLSIGTGSATYFGELNFNNKINDRFSQLSAGIEARLLNRIGCRIESAYIKLEGSDTNAPDNTFQKQRNLSFESRNFLVQLNGVYYLKPYQGDYYKRWVFDPYLATGVAYMFYNPIAKIGNEYFSLREAKTEGVSYRKWTLTIPLGAGAKFKVNEFLNINFEVMYHIAFTDYIDDVSNTYATDFSNTTTELLSDRKDEIGVVNPQLYDQIKPGAKRGTPSNNDNFMLISLKAEVFLPPQLFSRKKQPIIKKSLTY